MKKLILIALAACATAKPQQPPPAAKPAAAEAPPPQVTPDAPFRETAPPPGKPLEFHAPVPKQLALSNGLPVFLLERHEVPLVTVALALRSGADTEPPGKAGLSAMTLEMLDEGTQTRDAAAIARGFEDLAARYGTATDADASTLSVTALAETLPQVVELFADVALHPAFRAADVERVRTERLGGIAQALDDPGSVGAHVLARVIYGEKHPWGYPGEGTVKSVKSITRKDLAGWHAAYFRPSNAALFVVGDAAESDLLPLLEKQFGAWKDAKTRTPPAAMLPKGGERVITLVDKPDAPQSQIWIGEVGVSSSAPDLFAVRVMNNILGGDFDSRLNSNLRTEHAWSYGVFSFYETHREAGPFVAGGGVVSDKTAEAVTEFMRELKRMQTGEISGLELASAKETLVHSIPALFASNEQTAGAYARAWQHGQPADYYARFQAHVEAVTPDEVAKAARDRLHPDRMAIVVVGPAEALEEKLGKLGFGKVEFRDAQGEAKKAVKAAATKK
ncbi:MAG TPA: pitrilysin family protein [Myxococcales bacterium]|nr:pitrilysin family protein [Myxococcales bacterium]